jgi:hypothetical protein
MNITASSVNCTQVGDGWSAVETTANLRLAGGGWAALAPNTHIGNRVAVKMWLKGVTILGAVQAADADSPAYPDLPGPVSGYRMGLIQIIKKAPVMTARYEGFKYRRWLQKTIPFFDSTGVDASPWYNAGTRADLTAGANSQVTLQDYPTTVANVRFDTPTSGRIEELQKALDFDVFLAVAPRTARYKQAGIRVLWHLTWSTETHVKFSWNAAGQLSYTTSAFTRTASAPAAADAAASKTYVQAFPISAEGANEAISSADLV